MGVFAAFLISWFVVSVPASLLIGQALARKNTMVRYPINLKNELTIL